MDKDEDDEYIRLPDAPIRERLIMASPSPDDNADDDAEMKKAIENSICCFTEEQKEQEEQELQHIIEQSEKEFIENQIKEVEYLKEREREERKQILHSFIIRLEKLHFSEKKELLSTIQDYTECNTDILVLSQDTHHKLRELVDELYTIPKSKNRKTGITEEIYHILSKNLASL